MPDLAWLGGELLPIDDARVPALDRGFLFGDGVYEAIRGYAGRLWMFEAHWRRLARSLHEIGIDRVDLDAVARAVHDTVTAAGHDEPLVYLQVTRGVAPRRHAWSDDLEPTVLITVTPMPHANPRLREDGAACVTHPDWRWARCDIKSTNLLANCIAKQKAARAGAFEAILVEADGTVTEGSSTGLCHIANGALISHPDGPRILPSITRQRVLALAAELGIPVRLEPSHLLSVCRADEVFVVSTTAEVQPVVRIDDETIGDGRPGPLTRRLIEAFTAAVRDGRDT